MYSVTIFSEIWSGSWGTDDKRSRWGWCGRRGFGEGRRFKYPRDSLEKSARASHAGFNLLQETGIVFVSLANCVDSARFGLEQLKAILRLA